MTGKYLEADLYITDPKAIKKSHELLAQEPVPTSCHVECNKSYEERATFLRKISKEKC